MYKSCFTQPIILGASKVGKRGRQRFGGKSIIFPITFSLVPVLFAMHPAVAAVVAASYGLDLHLFQQAMLAGMQPQDMWGVTNAQLQAFLVVPPPAVLPPLPLVDVAAAPGERCCSKCAVMAIKVWCATCGEGCFLCYACMDSDHGDHEILRKKDVVEALDLTGEAVVASYAKAFPPRAPLCGHRDAYDAPACAKCSPLMRFDKAQCPICMEDGRDMHSSCPQCANVMACQACWKTLVTDAATAAKAVACPLCRNPTA